MSEMNEEMKKDVQIISETGATNMFDVRAVKSLAERLGFEELAKFLSDRKNYEAYGKFILTGK